MSQEKCLQQSLSQKWSKNARKAGVKAGYNLGHLFRAKRGAVPILAALVRLEFLNLCNNASGDEGAIALSAAFRPEELPALAVGSPMA